MNATHRENTPVVLVTRGMSSAAAQDEDIYLTLPIAAPSLPDQVQMVDVFLSVELAKHMITQLSEAVEVAVKRDVCEVVEPRHFMENAKSFTRNPRQRK